MGGSCLLAGLLVPPYTKKMDKRNKNTYGIRFICQRHTAPLIILDALPAAVNALQLFMSHLAHFPRQYRPEKLFIIQKRGAKTARGTGLLLRPTCSQATSSCCPNSLRPQTPLHLANVPSYGRFRLRWFQRCHENVSMIWHEHCVVNIQESRIRPIPKKYNFSGRDHSGLKPEMLF